MYLEREGTQSGAVVAGVGWPTSCIVRGGLNVIRLPSKRMAFTLQSIISDERSLADGPMRKVS